MRLHIQHQTFYHYDSPVRGVVQILRLTPRDHGGQHVLNWHIDVSEDCLLRMREDAFGNICHVFSASGSFNSFGVTVTGDIETLDTHGMVSGTVERFPVSLFLRETALTQCDEGLAVFAQHIGQETPGALDRLHFLQSRIHEEMVFDTDPTHSATTAAEAFALGRGVCQDFTHMFIACARFLGIPSRYISGYFHRVDGVVQQEAGHAWAEAWVPDIGWLGFDPANGICMTEAHVRLACGLDYLGAAPVRGTRHGGGGERLDVRVHVDQSVRQPQN